MGADEIRQFLSHLAVEGGVSASTQNVALCALLFLYRDVLNPGGSGGREPAGEVSEGTRTGRMPRMETDSIRAYPSASFKSVFPPHAPYRPDFRKKMFARAAKTDILRALTK
jgi:hypothetical protein